MGNLLSISEKDLQNLISNNTLDVSFELITPETAEFYLSKNFSNNRDLSPTNVAKHVKSMQNNAWMVSTDCIGFDVLGRLINGQHRLTALIESKTTQPFIVARNLPIQSAQVLDLGKKRMMHERLTIAGTSMSLPVCSAVRNAMTTYTDNSIGTVKYTDQHDDDYVFNVYKKHSQFFDLLEEKNLIKPSFFAAVAAKIYAEMVYDNYKRRISDNTSRYEHGMSPKDRALHFLYLALYGVSEQYQTNSAYDTAAIRLKELRDTRKAQNKHWVTINEFRLSVSAGFAFMQGKPLRAIRPAQKDPFRSFVNLPTTNY